MSRTAELQGIVQTKLTSLKYTAYADEAPDSAVYPYVVYNINNFSFLDARDNITLEVDIWDSSPNYVTVEAMADAIEAEFTGDAVYSSKSNVLPQFFRYLRTKVPDTDKKLKRINLKIEVQNYNITATTTESTATPEPEPEPDEENEEE